VTRDVAADALAFLATPVTPHPSLRARILAEALASRPSPDLFVVARDNDRWDVVMPGLERKALAGGPHGRTQSMLLRVAPGGRLPAHVHSAAEHLYVVAGSADQDGHRLRSGDYVYSPVGSRHGDAVTATGCLVLVVLVEA
jgi:anti-sigma factor ChrR (cupin superfamily)